MNITVVGDFKMTEPDKEEMLREFCGALGTEIITKGHVLLNGCRNAFDAYIAEAAFDTASNLGGDLDSPKRVIGYVLAGKEPAHKFGTILKSRLADWDLAKEVFYIPEQIRDADAVVVVGGSSGTFRASNWARIARKPLLPLASFGGAAAKIYGEELNAFNERYRGLVDRLDYEELNSVKDDPHAYATMIVGLAEKLAQSRSVLVIMSYGERPDLVDALDSFKQVASDLGYECDRVDEENAGERIVPEILDRIERAAFVIVDLTDLRPNVFYELGYADGLKKKVILTAKLGTDLPFDIKDMPTIFWESQKKLKDDLRSRINAVVKTGFGSAAAPTG